MVCEMKSNYNGERKEIFIKEERLENKFNKNAKDLDPLKENDTVGVKPFSLRDNVWIKAKELQCLEERSYLLKENNRVFRCNRIDTRKVPDAGLPGNKLVHVWHFVPLDCGRSVMECYLCFVLFLQKFSYIVYGAIKKLYFSSQFFILKQNFNNKYQWPFN